MTINDLISKLKNHLTSSDLQWLQEQVNAETAILTACDGRFDAIMALAAAPEAFKTYKTEQNAAWADYERIRDAALADYERIIKPALADYERIQKPAWADYQRIKDAALADYERIKGAARMELIEKA